MGTIPTGLMELVWKDSRELTASQIQEIRENGLGNGFTVLDPKDGFRQDNRVWFGRCSVCGEQVSNGLDDGKWNHSITKTITYHSSGAVCQTDTRYVDYCPTERGEEW